MGTLPIIVVTTLVTITGLSGWQWWVQNRTSGEVLAVQVAREEAPIGVPSPTLAPTLTPTPTPTPTTVPMPTVTVTPTPTAIPQPKLTDEQVYQLIERFSGQYGVDANVLRHIARCESGFNLTAKNGVYSGLYQFSSGTWRKYRVMMGENPDSDLRNNGEEAIQTAAFALAQGHEYIWPNCHP